jgi:hypothetical protein
MNRMGVRPHPLPTPIVVDAFRRDHFAPGTDVTITFLPGDNYRHNVETAATLHRAGYSPVPHIAARNGLARSARRLFWRGCATRLTSRASC